MGHHVMGHHVMGASCDGEVHMRTYMQMLLV